VKDSSIFAFEGGEGQLRVVGKQKIEDGGKAVVAGRRKKRQEGSTVCFGILEGDWCIT